MKYINKFSTNADYQAFTEGGGYVTPNICYVEETKGIVVKPKKGKIINYIRQDGNGFDKTWAVADYPVNSDIYGFFKKTTLGNFIIKKGNTQSGIKIEPDYFSDGIGFIGFSVDDALINNQQECEDDTYIYRIKN